MELVNVYSTGRTVDFQRYDDKDNQLIVSSYTNTEMDPNVDVVEVTVYGESGEFLDYNPIITTFKVAQGNVNPVTGFYTKIELDPKADVNALGLTRGRVSAQYNLLKPLFNSSNVSKYWIKEISPSGTELKLSSQNLSNEVIRAGFANFQAYVSTKNYYVDFYLNFGQNRLVIANNAILSEEDGEVYLLVKLYEPLPEDFEVKDTLWICDRIADSVIYTIDTQIVEDPTAVQNALRGPNNRIKVRERVGQTTPYYSYSSLFSSTVSSSLQQLLSYYQDKSIEINVDYSDFSNFIHFSSATERINNFVYKLGLIEQYRAEIEDTTTFSSMSPSSLTIVSQSNVLAQQSIDNIINKFDTYEYYLYFSSESFAWPKSNSTKPYQLYSVTSPQALTWLGSESTVPTATTASILYSASLYDNRNPDRLSNAIPQYLLEDPTNEPYVTFIDMVGQHFDNVWLYYKDLSNRYSSFNSPNLGLSKDMVADALRGFGFNLYTNTSVSDNLYYTLFGMNQDGSLLPPTGSEIITEYVTSSIDTLSPKQLDAEVYKRLYHNLTYLLKTKGTQRGVKALIASYGIPEEILDVNEFGGNNRYAGSGIYEINDQKINYFTQNTELSSSVLSPYVTLQSYNTDNRLNTNDIEVGFSPSDQINRNFVSSSGFVNLDQLIGNPRHQNLSYYPDLKTASDNYFASYNYPHSIWEYIRIIKYYNNSLFKTIKDFVPSKANASTGIIVKSHILERNKYARTEPSMSFDNNISESIDMISIAGSNPGAVQGSTQYADIINTSFGYVTKDYTEDLAKFTGKLSGSFVQATNGEAFEQDDYPDRLLPKRLRDGSAFVWYTDGIMKETQAEAEATAGSTSAFAYTESDTINVSSAVYATPDFSTQYQRTLINLIPLTFATYLGLNDGFGNEYVINIGAPLGGSLVIQIIQTKTASISYNNTNYGAIFQNVFTANRSKRFFELDYGFNQKVPTNFGLVTQSISSSINNNFNTYNDPYAPYADIQDYNYATRAFTDARYYGSKTTSLVYNTYTAPVSGGYEGDRSYGKTAAIDRNSIKLGWVKSFQSSSLNFFDKTSITLKYLVDENSNLIELNQRNENLFDVQNIFKSGENVIVSLSDIIKPSFQKTLDGTKTIFRGGFSYDPILFRENGEPLDFVTPSGSATSSSLGYKGIEKDWFGFANGMTEISKMDDRRGWSDLTKPTVATNTVGGLVLFVNNINKPDTPIANSSGFSQQAWQSYTNNNQNIQVSWGKYPTLSPTQLQRTRTGSFFEMTRNNASMTIIDRNGNRVFSTLIYPGGNPISLGNPTGTGLRWYNSFYNLGINDAYNRIYSINIPTLDIDFTNYNKADGGYFTDSETARPSNDLLFKAPRTGTYVIDMSIRFLLAVAYYKGSYNNDTCPSYLYNADNLSNPCEQGGSQRSPGGGVCFQLFFTIDKRVGTDWKVIASSTIGDVLDSKGNIIIDRDFSVIQFSPLQGSTGILENSFTANALWISSTLSMKNKEILLNAEDEIRLKLWFIDLDNFLTYGADMSFIMGEWSGEGFNPSYKTGWLPGFLEIKDKDRKKVDIQQTTRLLEASVFDASDNIIVFNNSASLLFDGNSIYSGSAESSKYYTPVIDTATVKPFDLIRFKPFKTFNPQYYIVISASFSLDQNVTKVGNNAQLQLFDNGVIKSGAIFRSPSLFSDNSRIIIPTYYNPSAFNFFTEISKNNKKFIVKNTNPTIAFLNEKLLTIKGVGSPWVEEVEYTIVSSTGANLGVVPAVAITVEETLPNTTFTNPLSITQIGSTRTAIDGIICSFQSVEPLTGFIQRLRVTLDRDIDTSLISDISANFAILRPKPDETSVIVDYLKFDGDVSQAILIPQDINKTTKEAIGNIYKSLNTDLLNN